MDIPCSGLTWTTDVLASTGKNNSAYSERKYSNCFIFSYELQIDDGYKNKGLGEHLMKALEALAKVWEMERVVLTLLTNNEGAYRFYKRLGYTLDDTTPDKSEETAYEIVSKMI